MEKKTVNILGTEYTVKECERDEDKRLCDCDGFCEKTTKEIVITKETKDSELTNWDWYRKKILRHEVIHAFFMESGLQENFENQHYGISETIVDWIAIQFPKIFKVFQELDIL